MSYVIVAGGGGGNTISFRPDHLVLVGFLKNLPEYLSQAVIFKRWCWYKTGVANPDVCTEKQTVFMISSLFLECAAHSVYLLLSQF